MTEQQQLPEKLYKYRSWSDPLHRRIITHREIWFASPRSFNDPFDCKIRSSMYQMEEDQLLEYFHKHFKNSDIEEERDHPESYAQEFFDLITGATKSMQKTNDHKMIRKFAATTGIFTVSDTFDDILMWSHYSESHKGFCVEIDTVALQSLFEERADSTNITPYVLPVTYSDDYPDMIRVIGSDTEAWLRQYLIKSKRWLYEGEFRIIEIAKADFAYVLKPKIITKVILGCQMPDSDQEAIIHELLKQGGEIALERAVKLKDKFGLKFEPVKY